MTTTNNTNNTAEQSVNPADWSSFYAELQQKGNVPDASCAVTSQNSAIFRGMYQDLSVIKQTISQSSYTPVITTIYADVLFIPDDTNWLLQSSGLVIFARRLEVAGNASVLLDYRQSATARLVVFAAEMAGTLTASAVLAGQPQPIQFNITADNIKPGITISNNEGTPSSTTLTLSQGIGFQLPADMELYLNNSFIYGSLLYDQNAALALSLFTWVKNWASQSSELQELFYRSTNLVTLLSSQINAQINGAVFVPYLTKSIYTSLAQAFAAVAAKYESDYTQLSTQKVLTDEGIQLAKTMVDNAQSEIDYVKALQKQANDNYHNAVAAAEKAKINFNKQQLATQMVAADFEQIGLPEYEREQIIKAIFQLVTAVVTFGAAIAAMAFGQEEAAPAAAEGAISATKAVAEAADTAKEVAKTANSLAETMKKLKKLVEVLQKVYELAKAVMEVANNIEKAESQVKVIQDLNAVTDGADLSASDSWAIFKLETDAVMKEPVDKGIHYAAAYQQALAKLVIYGQSLSAAQLAVVKTSQQNAAILFQLHYAQQKQDNLQKYVNSLQTGEAPILAMMQQFYQKYIDAKSSLFSALKSYQSSYFYWALRPSSVQPVIVDSVNDLNAGIQDITEIALDQANALDRFDPPPQTMENIWYEVTDADVLKDLKTNGQTTWVLPIDAQEFLGLDRVRLDKVRIWLEGAVPGTTGMIYVNITTAGNYLDRYDGINYQFNSKLLTRPFKYQVVKPGHSQGQPDWKFDNGELGYVQLDGSVDKEVEYAYFQPTPFSEWSISLLSNNPGLNFSAVSKITMYFEGSAIGTTSSVRNTLTQNT